MKQLKSTLADLRHLFERSITLRYIAEPLASFRFGDSAADALKYMEAEKFDVLGVTSRGVVRGYIPSSISPRGKVGKYITLFTPGDLTNEDSPLSDVFSLLSTRPRIFLTNRGTVTKIVTRGDLQKAPVRMWLFGLVSLIEMHFLRLVRQYDDSERWWLPLVGRNAVKKATEILADRQRRTQEIDLADCLEFPHKAAIILKTAPLATLAGLKGGRPGARLVRRLTELRNNLAHAQDIITGYWPGIIEIVRDAETLLSSCERSDFRIKSPSNHRMNPPAGGGLGATARPRSPAAGYAER